ncbi:helix-turn-helix domain-containing protein [Paenibacillus sp. ACRRX]|uniref:helix-turn-helix domain-containing protein n=1 Tax=unclassified Paenibacillus TaxID=185978 RepID=UPI001EF6C8C4|nr:MULTISPECIES: helix-turn-helix domain-containing protein [unclassified Paenibacillus]MCG7409254.1 helix-turn-helix domain-containing protein [Paenibacillus sp. ACRRX]MDK8179909.1 helix-turn-helix domain-containing protein [Paenibacillus sp. UMB4589-SE434]
MNTTTYELQDVRMLAEPGTQSPAALILSYPAVIVPTEAIVLRTASSMYKVNEGQCIVLRHAEECMSMITANRTEFAPVYAVIFQSYVLSERTDTCLLYRISHENIPAHGAVMEFSRHSFALLMSLMAQLRRASWSRNASRLDLMLDELLSSVFRSKAGEFTFMSHNDAIKDAVIYVNQHFDTSISRSFMAQMTGFNQSYFSSLFHKETGWSFAEYLTRIRIEEAKRRLLSTSDNLNDIAYKTGFADGSYLGKAFRKVVGLTPSAFRQRRGTTRIIGMQFLGALLAVGIKPLATTAEVLRSSLLLLEDLEGIVEIDELHIAEQLKPLAPDFILIPSYYYQYPDLLKALERVAPVVTLEWGKMDKLDEVRVIGSLFGRTMEAERWITRLQQKALAARQAIRQCIGAHETVALYEQWHDQRWLIPYDSVRSAFNLYQLLELTPPLRVQEEVLDQAKHLFIQEQDLMNYAADHMFFIVPCANTEAFEGKMISHGVWLQLRNEHQCHFYVLQLEEFWMDEGVSLEKQMDVLVNLLTSGQWIQQ